jgi:hypothetical protein
MSTYDFDGIEIDFFRAKRRDGEGDCRFIDIAIDGRRYQLYVSPKGKSVRFFGPKGEMKSPEDWYPRAMSA